jgi:hypothetical protein
MSLLLLWTRAAAADVSVDCAPQEGMPWCSASVEIQAPVSRIDGILTNLDGLEDVFPRIESSILLSPDTLYVVLEMPFPLVPRDYVARFTRQEADGAVSLSWEAALHPDAPQGVGNVRLPHTAGVWTIRPLSADRTEVRYQWNADLGGDIPSWALPRAWQMQGDEVLGRLKVAAEGASK